MTKSPPQAFINMSVRDHMAITSPISLGDAAVALGYEISTEEFADPMKWSNMIEKLAKLKYEYADAMIAVSGEESEMQVFNETETP